MVYKNIGKNEPNRLVSQTTIKKGTTAKSDSSLKSSNYFKKVTVIPLPRTVTKKVLSVIAERLS